jgi:tryptophan synthase alpha chain
LPVAVGFGVRSAAQASAIAAGADAVVVGSALVEAVRASLNDGAATPETAAAVHRLVAELAGGVRAAAAIAEPAR